MKLKKGLIGILLASTLSLSSGCSITSQFRDYRNEFRHLPRDFKESIGNPFEDKEYWNSFPKEFWRSIFGKEEQGDQRYDFSYNSLDFGQMHDKRLREY
ncbi:MAG: hypothetical protein Q8Q31_04040 [Nanoarchaeota archaeon]|nr:hypothetical protein [Nanoarchaeota archaeon]